MIRFIQELKTSLNVYYQATGVGLVLLDKNGKELAMFGNPNAYCDLIHQEEEQKNKCMHLHQALGKEAGKLGECYFSGCHGNMMHFALALIDHGEYVGSVVAGPVMAEYPSAQTLDEVIEKCNVPSGCRSLFLTAMKDIQVVEPNRMYYLGELLYHLVSHLFSADDLATMHRQRDRKRQQELIGMAIQDLKAEGKKNGSADVQNQDVLRRMQERQELDLIERLALGDLPGAQDILNDILGNIYFTSGDVGMIRLRINELLTVLARRMIQNGADSNKVYKLVNDFQKESIKSENAEEISYALAQLLPNLVVMLRDDYESEISELVRMSLEFIHRNFRTDISLDDAARYVSCNSAYFSRLFKHDMKIGFVTYVNRLRISKAKELLLETEMSLSEITQTVGFSNQQYFTKVFKAETQKTPGQYRKEKQG